MAEIVPAILVYDRQEFLKRVGLVAPYIDRVQWDIMDGVFVDNITFSDPSVLDELDGLGFNPLPKIEVDLMVSDPQNWINRLHHPGIDRLIFHVESLPANPKGLIEEARAAGFAVGIACEPGTVMDSFWELLSKVDRFQAMGGRSGFGGQKFHPAVLETIKKVRGEFPHLHISVDIGVNAQTAPQIVAAGADILVVGSFIFDSDDLGSAIESLRLATGDKQPATSNNKHGRR